MSDKLTAERLRALDAGARDALTQYLALGTPHPSVTPDAQLRHAFMSGYCESRRQSDAAILAMAEARHRMREALEPFARVAYGLEKYHDAEWVDADDAFFQAGVFRHARRVFREEGQHNPGDNISASARTEVPPVLDTKAFDDRSEERVCINGTLFLRADFAARRYQGLRDLAEGFLEIDEASSRSGDDCRVFVDMRDWAPFLAKVQDTLKMCPAPQVAGRERALGKDQAS